MGDRLIAVTFLSLRAGARPFFIPEFTD